MAFSLNNTIRDGDLVGPFDDGDDRRRDGREDHVAAVRALANRRMNDAVALWAGFGGRFAVLARFGPRTPVSGLPVRAATRSPGSWPHYL